MQLNMHTISFSYILKYIMNYKNISYMIQN